MNNYNCRWKRQLISSKDASSASGSSSWPVSLQITKRNVVKSFTMKLTTTINLTTKVKTDKVYICPNVATTVSSSSSLWDWHIAGLNSKHQNRRLLLRRRRRRRLRLPILARLSVCQSMWNIARARSCCLPLPPPRHISRRAKRTRRTVVSSYRVGVLPTPAKEEDKKWCAVVIRNQREKKVVRRFDERHVRPVQPLVWRGGTASGKNRSIRPIRKVHFFFYKYILFTKLTQLPGPT